jgi:N-acetylglucosaminyldiphosphoundecaprenol N-acetyl-beta-D-mannosaminyltransferase
MDPANTRTRAPILDTEIDALSWDATVMRIASWARRRESRYVCLCNVHSVVTASLEAEFRDAINGADMAAPDGMPVAWALSRLGFPRQPRINGPDLMSRLCAYAAKSQTKVFFYGSSPQTLTQLENKIITAFPGIRIAGMISPPFRALSAEENDAMVKLINNSGAELLFVGLGCPKQELWMASQRGKINAVMLGVGAAFDYHAGTLQRAPGWMQRGGLEWLYRFGQEPRRLWRRYLVTNTIFVMGMARQLLTRRKRQT